ncbi:NAD-dependent epimerase/dehydratase family protein [Bacillus alkalicellulosilyticus]|uniref:NAD-dependent epimerase/dehydratase family protein n=1 Tax=Alkalihalobacterium alkalicellulosilyticum TaxID=1912214 RepID=UPI000998172A|nr:NAD(P)-dependent oxidoreductase [Bacillus alkalicellulosilyticus]
MKRALVTGALGFIGFHLCERLLNNGIEVIGIDGLLQPENKKIAEHKLDFFGRNASFILMEKKISEIEDFQFLEECDVIYHLAADLNVEDSWSRIRDMIQNNVEDSRLLAKHCPERTKFIFTSSVEVYGVRTGTITERTPTNPITAYGITKLASELAIKDEAVNRDVICLRIPTIYGPWQRQDMCYHQMLVQKITSETIESKPDRSTIDLLYVDDVVDALVKAGESSEKAGIINISSGTNHQWYEGVAHIKGDEMEPPHDKRLHVMISNEKAREVLQFTPSTTIEKGIYHQEETIKRHIDLYL